MGHRSQIHRLLGTGRSQQGKAGLAAGHHIGMISEDGQGMSGQGPGRYMEHAREQLTGNLVHVGDHQQQPLRCGVGGGQGTRPQAAVDGTGSASLTLHLHHSNRLSK